MHALLALWLLLAPGDFSAWAGDWYRHGFLLRLNEQGGGFASWRVYRWCGPAVPAPCDGTDAGGIVNGGSAQLALDRDAETGLSGRVLASNQPERLRVGWFGMVRLAGGLAVLVQGGGAAMVLCGPTYQAETPPELQEHGLCGA